MNKPFLHTDFPDPLKSRFSKLLMRWHEADNKRQMPWKGLRDPYLIWISEIILQQTRVEQGWSYFERFRQRFPTLQSLALAKEDQVLKLWEGLGYYSRARNLHFTAQHIHINLKGKFPSDYEQILSLKGVGSYTAAAISSFAFDLPTAVVDGNVIRLLSRFFGIYLRPDTASAKKSFSNLANHLLPEGKSAAYNQAIMDFGATVCKPLLPDCGSCPLRQDCFAFKHKVQNDLPIKKEPSQKRLRYFNYLIIRKAGKLLIEKRMGNDIWKNLYQFPMLESDRPMKIHQLLDQKSFSRLSPMALSNDFRLIWEDRQTLSHQLIEARFFLREVSDESDIPSSKELKFVSAGALKKLAFPKMIDRLLREKLTFDFDKS